MASCSMLWLPGSGSAGDCFFAGALFEEGFFEADFVAFALLAGAFIAVIGIAMPGIFIGVDCEWAGTAHRTEPQNRI